ncbi:hypothetical protein GCM10028803_33660 [Larkinella knui]
MLPVQEVGFVAVTSVASGSGLTTTVITLVTLHWLSLMTTVKLVVFVKEPTVTLLALPNPLFHA